MSYLNPEQSPDENPGDSFADIVTMLEDSIAEPPSATTLERLESISERLRKMSSLIVSDSISAVHSIDSNGCKGVLSLACSSAAIRNQQGSISNETRLVLELSNETGNSKTIRLTHGETVLDAVERAALTQAVLHVADELPTNQATWLYEACMTTMTNVPEIAIAINGLIQSSPYSRIERSIHELADIKFNNNTRLAPAQWTRMNETALEGMRPNTVADAIRLYTQTGTRYEYARTYAGDMTLSVTTLQDRDLAGFRSNPLKLIRTAQLSRDLGLHRPTDSSMTAFVDELEKAINAGPAESTSYSL
jgi:hypothetical protein